MIDEHVETEYKGQTIQFGYLEGLGEWMALCDVKEVPWKKRLRMQKRQQTERTGEKMKIKYRGYELNVDYHEDLGLWLVVSYILTDDVDMDAAIEKAKRKIDDRWKEQDE